MEDAPLVATITCRTCRETKPVTEFDRRNDSGQRHRLCKACRRTYQRQRLQCLNPPAPRSQRIVGSSDVFRCTRCERSLPAAAFPRRAKGSAFLQSWCRECFSVLNRANYAANRGRETARIHANQRRRKEVNRTFLREYLAAHPCVDCGEADPDVLEFDHLRDKLYDVSLLVQSGRSVSLIIAEIDKCEVRCANCHRRVTRRRQLASNVAQGYNLQRPRTDSNRRLLRP